MYLFRVKSNTPYPNLKSDSELLQDNVNYSPIKAIKQANAFRCRINSQKLNLLNTLKYPFYVLFFVEENYTVKTKHKEDN